jgi:O-antigen ligase
MTAVFLAPAMLLLAALAYVRYHAAVVCLAALLPAYLIRFTIAGIPTNALETAIVVTALVGVARREIRQDWLRAWRQLPWSVLGGTMLIILGAAVGTLVSPHPWTSLGVLKGWILAPLVMGWIVFIIGEDARTRRRVQTSLLASAVIMAVVGLSGAADSSRVQGVYDVPNSLALFLAPLAVLAWWERRSIVAVVLTSAILATQSAAAIVAIAVPLAIGAVLWPRSAGKRTRGALAVLVIAAAVYLTVTGRLVYLVGWQTEDTPNSIAVRRQLWSVSWELIKERPLVGVGLGTFEPAYQKKLHERFASYQASGQVDQLPRPIAEFVFRDPHSWPLSFWLNSGLVGLIGFIGLHVAVLQTVLWRAPRGIPRAAQALLLSILALLVFGLVDTIFWKNDLAALQLILLALLLNQGRANRIQNDVR